MTIRSIHKLKARHLMGIYHKYSMLIFSPIVAPTRGERHFMLLFDLLAFDAYFGDGTVCKEITFERMLQHDGMVFDKKLIPDQVPAVMRLIGEDFKIYRENGGKFNMQP